MTNPLIFKEQKYLDIKSMIPKDLCRIVTKYGLLKEEFEFRPEEGADAQVRNAHAVYSDTLMETLIHFLQPHMEKQTGLSLCPTYTYYRVYRPGMVLEKHVDRPSCEISTTICFGFNYIHDDPEYRWGMYLGENKLITQNPGDAIIYRGCDVEHWRDPFETSAGSWQVQGFFHFVDKSGPFYPAYAYDKRPGLGFKQYDK